MHNSGNDDEQYLDDRENPDPSDMDDDLDATDTEPCPFCQKDIMDTTDICPYCGNFILRDEPAGSRSPVIVVGVILALLVVLVAWIIAR